MTAGKKLGGYEFFKSIGSPSKIVAPMVDQSELAYRLLVRRYGAELCYTPMFHSRLFVEKPDYRAKCFQPNQYDRPLIAQFCGHDPDTVLQAAKYLEPHCDAIDLNLGCPQGIARKGKYGAFLLEETDLVCSIVKKLHDNLSIPVTCKIRILPDIAATLELCHRLVEAGCQLLVVHGRTKEMNKTKVKECDWDTIRLIKKTLSIPVIANGGIENLADVNRCLEYTGTDGVMTSEAILESPALFTDGYSSDGTMKKSQLDLAREYLDLCWEYPPHHHKVVKAHMFKFLFQHLKVYTDLRQQMTRTQTLQDVDEILKALEARPPVLKDQQEMWYRRHRKATT